MYRGIVFGNGMRDKEMTDWLSRGFDKPWTKILLPHFRDLYAVDYVDLLCFGEMLFFNTDLNSLGSIFHFPVPIVGTIVPIVNHMIEEETIWSHQKTYSQRSEHSAVLSRVMNMYRYYGQPVVLLIINGNDPPTTSEDHRSDWWDVAVWQDVLQSSNNSKIPISVVECSIDQLEEFPYLIGKVLQLRPEHFVDDRSSSHIPHPSLPNVTIDPTNLGIETDMPQQFVEECLTQLMPTHINFRIWVDVVESSFSDSSESDHQSYETADYKRGALGFRIFDRNVLLAIASLPHQYPKRSYHPAYHIYLEYEGCVFDGLMAFQRPMDTVEYQARLNSTWRTHIDITPQMMLEELITTLRTLLGQIKDWRNHGVRLTQEQKSPPPPSRQFPINDEFVP